MSLFKEKDDFILQAFANQFNQDSDDEEDEDKLEESQEHKDDEHSEKKQKLEEKTPTSELGDQNSALDLKTSPTIECIDIDCDVSIIQETGSSNKKLISNEVISISSSDESDAEENINQADESLHYSQNNVSYDLDDRDFNLKLTLAGSYKQFKTTYKTQLKDTLIELMGNLRTRGKRLILTLEGSSISFDESPYSLKLKPGTILEAIEVTEEPTTNNNFKDPNKITVKLQDGNKKHTKEFTIATYEPVMDLKKLYAKEFSIDNIARIKLIFDGDVLEDESTLEDNDIEDDCVIDVVLS